jgi:hypothetical protein
LLLARVIGTHLLAGGDEARLALGIGEARALVQAHDGDLATTVARGAIDLDMITLLLAGVVATAHLLASCDQASLAGGVVRTDTLVHASKTDLAFVPADVDLFALLSATLVRAHLLASVDETGRALSVVAATALARARAHDLRVE